MQHIHHFLEILASAMPPKTYLRFEKLILESAASGAPMGRVLHKLGISVFREIVMYYAEQHTRQAPMWREIGDLKTWLEEEAQCLKAGAERNILSKATVLAFDLEDSTENSDGRQQRDLEVAKCAAHMCLLWDSLRGLARREEMARRPILKKWVAAVLREESRSRFESGVVDRLLELYQKIISELQTKPLPSPRKPQHTKQALALTK